jgi:hypothetical protein
VWIDGVEIRDTPLVNHQLTPGRHIVEIRREGYRTWVDTVNVVARNTLRRNPILIENER